MRPENSASSGKFSGMRLLIDCSPLSGGGGAQVASAFLEFLLGEPEYDWLAVVPKSMLYSLTDKLKADPRVRLVSKRSWLDLLLIRFRLRSITERFDPEIVFTVFGPGYFRASRPHLVGFALPLMIYDTEPPLDPPSRVERFKTMLGIRAFQQADHIVVETQTVKQRLAERLSINPENISVIGNSVNPVFARSYQDASAGEGSCFRILVPSAYYRHKNLEMLPAVCAELQRRDPALEFEICVTLADDGRAWHDLSAQAAQLGVSNRLKTVGVLSLEDLAKQYAMASAIFLPTMREASTAVYPEAFFAERPLVTTDIDFARELCGEAALFSRNNDPPAAAEALIKLAKNPALCRELVNAGKLQLKKTYPDPDTKFQMQIALLHAIVADRRKRDGVA